MGLEKMAKLAKCSLQKLAGRSLILQLMCTLLYLSIAYMETVGPLVLPGR